MITKEATPTAERNEPIEEAALSVFATLEEKPLRPEPEAGRVPVSKVLIALFVGSALYRFALAAVVTGFTLVDDAYIHLRYARNLVEQGSFVYNPGEAVFGLTSPLYGLLAAALYALFGANVEVAVIGFNILLWTAAGLLLLRELPSRTQFPLMSLFLLAPVFVDNQLLGMETPLFVLLLVGSIQAARRGDALKACLWFGPALITRPEAILLVPFLLFGFMRQFSGWSGARRLLRPAPMVALLGPGVAWVGFALWSYGSLIPQSMVAKTGWNSTHYDGIFSLQNALLTVPRLSFLPFIDYFAAPLQWALVALLLAGIGWVAYCNLKRGSAASRAWLGFYLVYLSFYLAGKGATEASWYAVPSSVALLCAAGPALPSWITDSGRWGVRTALVLGLLAVSTGAAIQRGPLLNSYVEGYGACADFLEVHGNPQQRTSTKVVIGEIGVFGFQTSHPVVDVGALVSPEVLPWKNAGFSFTRIVQESEAAYFVISERALELNRYPSVGVVWASDVEREWFDERCRHIADFKDKHMYAVTPAEIVSQR